MIYFFEQPRYCALTLLRSPPKTMSAGAQERRSVTRQKSNLLQYNDLTFKNTLSAGASERESGRAREREPQRRLFFMEVTPHSHVHGPCTDLCMHPPARTRSGTCLGFGGPGRPEPGCLDAQAVHRQCTIGEGRGGSGGLEIGDTPTLDRSRAPALQHSGVFEKIIHYNIINWVFDK